MGRRVAFDFLHGLLHRRPECLQDPVITVDRVQHRDALGGMEVEVVADRAVRLGPLRQPLAIDGVVVLGQRHERASRNALIFSDPGQTQQVDASAAPSAGDLLAVDVIVLAGEALREIRLRRLGALALVDPQHESNSTAGRRI